jgi:hypothetical protein
MDSKTLLELIEKNPGAKSITVEKLPDSIDPDWEREKEEIKREYFRPECFPPELKHLMPDFSKDLPPKD